MLLPRPEPHAMHPLHAPPIFARFPQERRPAAARHPGARRAGRIAFLGVVGHVIERRRQVKTRRGWRRLLSSSTSILAAKDAADEEE